MFTKIIITMIIIKSFLLIILIKSVNTDVVNIHKVRSSVCRNLEKLFVSPEVILIIIYNILMSLIYFFDNYFSIKSPSKTKRNQQLRDFDWWAAQIPASSVEGTILSSISHSAHYQATFLFGLRLPVAPRLTELIFFLFFTEQKLAKSNLEASVVMRGNWISVTVKSFKSLFPGL